MNIKPRKNNILIERDEVGSRESEFGILTPDNVDQEQKAFGIVLEVGPDVKDVKKGDHVIYGAYAGEQIEVEIKGKKHDYRLVPDEDVIAFLS